MITSYYFFKNVIQAAVSAMNTLYSLGVCDVKATADGNHAKLIRKSFHGGGYALKSLLIFNKVEMHLGWLKRRYIVPIYD